jgi:DNA polymerase II small subunit/DNA polymerase delta subunit B
MALYRVKVKKFTGEGNESELQILKTVLADVNGENVKILSPDLGDQIYGRVQMHGSLFESDLRLDREFVNEIRSPIMLAMKENENSIKEDEEIKFKSSLKRRTEQELNYINSRLDRLELMVAEGRGIEAILLNDIANLRDKKDKLIQNQEKAHLEVGHALISTNLIEIV